MDLAQLQKSVLEMTDEEVYAKLAEIRERRRERGAVTRSMRKKKVKAKPKIKTSDLSSLSDADKALLREMLGTGSEG